MHLMATAGVHLYGVEEEIPEAAVLGDFEEGVSAGYAGEGAAQADGATSDAAQYAAPTAAVDAAAGLVVGPHRAAGALPWLSCRDLSRHSGMHACMRGLTMGT